MKAHYAVLLTLLWGAAPASGADSAAYHISARIAVPDGAFDYATFDAATHRVYMPRGSFTTVIDTITGVASRLENAASDHIALPIPGNMLLLTQRSGVIRLVDPNTDKVLGDMQGGKNPNSAVYDPATGTIFVMNKNSGDAAIIEPRSHAVVATIPISPNTLEFPATDGKGHVFDNIETTAEIAVIDTALRKVTGTYKLAGCEEPSGLAYVPGDDLLISACGNGIAKVVRAGDGKEVASLPIGKGPDAVIYDPQHRMAFVPCGQDGVLTVISLKDPAHIAVAQTVATQQGSRTGTVDPGTGRVYLMASKPDTKAAVPPGGRAPRLSGSWEVLVISP